MRITVSFDLDIDDSAWVNYYPADAGDIPASVNRRAHSVIAELFTDCGLTH